MQHWVEKFNLDEMIFSEFLEISRTSDDTDALKKPFCVVVNLQKVLFMELLHIYYNSYARE